MEKAHFLSKSTIKYLFVKVNGGAMPYFYRYKTNNIS
jgi:hypothetical protein